MKYLFFLVISIGCASCVKNCHRAGIGIGNGGLIITFFHTSKNEYFFLTNNYLSPYSTDSIKVKDSNGRILEGSFISKSDPVNPSKGYKTLNASPIYNKADDQIAFQQEHSKFLYFDFGQNTFDTIQVVYKARTGKCVDEFEYIKAYHRGILVAETNDQNLILRINH